MMRALAYVEAEPDVDVSGLHVGLPSVGSFRPPRPCRGTVMTPGAGIHITRRPHPCPVAVFLRMGRVPISGRGRPACGGNTPGSWMTGRFGHTTLGDRAPRRGTH